jgi:hypothetical protein
MLDINNKVHISVIIKSLENIYNYSKIYGVLNPEDLNYLNIIYKLLNSCHLDLTIEQIQKLTGIYENIKNVSKFICPELIYPKHIQTKTKFVQAESEDCNEFTVSNKIFYWEDARLGGLFTISTLSEEIVTQNYFVNKLYKTKELFNTGVNINYLLNGKRIYAVSESNTLNYQVFDVSNNLNLTSFFDFQIIPQLNMTLIMSNKDYAPEQVTIRIKKIN